jgi:hypothetical protein
MTLKVKKEGKLRTLLKTTKAKVTARADEVKALEKTLKEFRVEKKEADRQKDRSRVISYTSSPLRCHV